MVEPLSKVLVSIPHTAKVSKQTKTPIKKKKKEFFNKFGVFPFLI
jgi:hypothetical protein